MSTSEFFDSVNATTNLAGTNKMELLIFELLDEHSGQYCSYGINVFKVREIMETPQLTGIPNNDRTGVVGMLRLRGDVISILDLPFFMGLEQKHRRDCLIVTEYSGHTQGFLVDRINNIVRLDWSAIKPVPMDMGSKLITAVAEVEDQLVLIVDVEAILMQVNPSEYAQDIQNLDPIDVDPNRMVYFAEDSKTAHGLICATLEKLGINYRAALNGRQAYDGLIALADQHGDQLNKHLGLVLTDLEMPEMDGFTLIKTLKADPRFNGIPMLIQSSLTGDSNRELGKKVNADGFIDKFNPAKLAQAISQHMGG